MSQLLSGWQCFRFLFVCFTADSSGSVSTAAGGASCEEKEGCGGGDGPVLFLAPSSFFPAHTGSHALCYLFFFLFIYSKVEISTD